MPANTPWCPRCGDWRGYSDSICKGCHMIEDMLLQLPGTITDPKTKLTVMTSEATPEMTAAVRKERLKLTGERFSFISEKRTEREAYTQALEQFVDDRVDMMKTIAYEWGELRVEANKFKFSQMYAWELMSAMELALTELGGVSLALSKYDKNTPQHEERMQRVASWLEVLNKFRSPDASEKPAEEAASEDPEATE